MSVRHVCHYIDSFVSASIPVYMQTTIMSAERKGTLCNYVEFSLVKDLLIFTTWTCLPSTNCVFDWRSLHCCHLSQCSSDNVYTLEGTLRRAKVYIFDQYPVTDRHCFCKCVLHLHIYIYTTLLEPFVSPPQDDVGILFYTFCIQVSPQHRNDLGRTKSFGIIRTGRIPSKYTVFHINIGYNFFFFFNLYLDLYKMRLV